MLLIVSQTIEAARKHAEVQGVSSSAWAWIASPGLFCEYPGARVVCLPDWTAHPEADAIRNELIRVLDARIVRGQEGC